MRNLAVLLLFTLAASAQKKPITLDTLQSGRTRRSAAGFAGAPTWLPDGKTFVFRQGRSPPCLRSRYQGLQAVLRHLAP